MTESLSLREPLKRILAHFIAAALPDTEEAHARLSIAVKDGHFDEAEAAIIRTAIELQGREAA